MARSRSPARRESNKADSPSAVDAHKETAYSKEKAPHDSRDSKKKASKEKHVKKEKSKDKDRSKERDSKRRREHSRERAEERGNSKRPRHSRSRSKDRSRDRGTTSGEPSKAARNSEPSKSAARTTHSDAPAKRSSERAEGAAATSRPHSSEGSKDAAPGPQPDKVAAVAADDPDVAPKYDRIAVESSPLPPPPKPAAAPEKAEPLSLEELMRRREAAALAASKPVFLSKKQREEQALKRRQEEVAAKAAAAEAAAAERSNGAGADSRDADRRRDNRPDDRRSDRYDDRRTDRRLDDRRVDDRRGDRRYDDRRVDRRPSDRRDDRREDRRDDRRGDGYGETDRQQRDAERERNKELEMIKAQYLGVKKEKKKVLKGAEKFKFNFDWAAGDDTSRDLNPLYNSTHESALLFGRGLMAGVDRREQKKQAASHEAELLRKVREAQGIKETREDRQRDRNRQALAEGYERSSMKMGQHWKEKKREEMTERDWRIFREDYNIGYKGAMDKSTLPIRNWSEAGLPADLVKAVETMGYTEPSPIQMAAIPLGLQFRDVIGVAETGSGKTAAFVLPMLTYILGQPVMTEEVAAEGPYAVIMAPTRELAQQIEEESLKMAQYTEFRFVCVVGGQNIEEQGFKLRKGCEVIIATPGRLIDCLEQRYAVLNQCNYIVLDEADRMIDLGFEPQVIGVMDAMPTSHLKPEGEDVVLEANRVYRTTYMFSATMPMAVERLARKYLRRPVVINIGSAGKAVDLIKQHIIITKENEKAGYLERELREAGDKRVVVFVNTKRQCDVVAGVLGDRGVACTILHGGKSQDQREAGLAGFREGSFTVLVATDVAGRGIDVPDVALVCNYDMPNSIENYTHRIGRTGRAGRTGKAVTFLTMGDTEVFYDLKKFLEESKASVPSQLASHEASRTKPGSVENRRDKIQYAKK